MGTTSSTTNKPTSDTTNKDTTTDKDTTTGGGGDDIDAGQVALDSQKAMAATMAAQSAIQIAGMKAQLVTAGLNIMGQTVGATTSMAVQVVTDLVKTSKDAVKQQGEAFQKAN
jgi:hypothetical protein